MHTIECYKKAYESGVTFGLRKAIQAELKLEELEDHKRDASARVESELHDIGSVMKDDLAELRNLKDKAARMEEYFEQELAKRDKIIEQQRAFIRNVTQESVDGVQSLIK